MVREIQENVSENLADPTCATLRKLAKDVGRQKRSLTVPSPFNLSSGRSRPAPLVSKLRYVFRARKPTGTLPFIVSRSTKPPTKGSDFKLFTQIRAEKRRAFDLELRKRREQAVALRQNLESIEKTENRSVQIAFRKTLEFSSNPVRHYPSVIVQKSQKKLTVPQSPMLLTGQRGSRAHPRS